MYICVKLFADLGKILCQYTKAIRMPAIWTILMTFMRLEYIHYSVIPVYRGCLYTVYTCAPSGDPEPIVHLVISLRNSLLVANCVHSGESKYQHLQIQLHQHTSCDQVALTGNLSALLLKVEDIEVNQNRRSQREYRLTAFNPSLSPRHKHL